MNRDYEVIVVGGGPGGATAARFCAQAGLRTLLVEQERMPRHKPCGGCLSSKTVQLLGIDLSPVVENTIQEVKFTYCLQDSFSIQSPRPIAVMVMRNRFDQFLIEKSSAEGAEILEEEGVVGLEEKGNGVEVELAKAGKVRCEYLVGADGPGSIVARSFRPMRNGRDRFGLESEISFESAVDFPREDLHMIHFDFGRIENGYGWVFPKKRGLSIGIGGVFGKVARVNPLQEFKAFVKGLSYIAKTERVEALGHQIPVFYDERQRVSKGRLLLVGDAAHLVDPLTGEGIYNAIRSGMLAAGAISQSKERGVAASVSYQKAIRDSIIEDLKWALHVSRFIYRVPKLAYRTLRQYPELGNLYIQVMEGRRTYRGFVTQVRVRAKDILKGRLNGKMRWITGGP